MLSPVVASIRILVLLGLSCLTNDATNRRDDTLDYNLGVYQTDTESDDRQRGQI